MIFNFPANYNLKNGLNEKYIAETQPESNSTEYI